MPSYTLHYSTHVDADIASTLIVLRHTGLSNGNEQVICYARMKRGAFMDQQVLKAVTVEPEGYFHPLAQGILPHAKHLTPNKLDTLNKLASEGYLPASLPNALLEIVGALMGAGEVQAVDINISSHEAGFNPIAPKAKGLFSQCFLGPSSSEGLLLTKYRPYKTSAISKRKAPQRLSRAQREKIQVRF